MSRGDNALVIKQVALVLCFPYFPVSVVSYGRLSFLALVKDFFLSYVIVT